MRASSQRVTVPSIIRRKVKDRKVKALTAYDFTTARLLDQAGIDLILVGDSLSAVVQGLETTLPVTLDEMIYHCRCVARGVERALVVGDMPFMSYQSSPERALESAGRLLKESGVGAVKLEGGIHIADTIERLVQVDIPVMGHVGLTPQSYHRMGGHKIQGKRDTGKDRAGSRDRILRDAKAVEQAGIFALVLEGMPSDLAAEITELVSVPTIGIGAGPHCDGQILVTHDMLGMSPETAPSFVREYANLADVISSAAKKFSNEVENGSFPEEREVAVKLVE